MAFIGERTETVWFLDTRVRLHVGTEEAEDALSLVESWAPRGDSPPYHVHHREDELFYVLEGTFRFRVGDEEVTRRAGESLLIPKGAAHTYRVESDAGRWLVVTTSGDFERLVRAVGRPAEHDGLPVPAGPPSPEAAQALAEAAMRHHIEILGPPLH